MLSKDDQEILLRRALNGDEVAMESFVEETYRGTFIPLANSVLRSEKNGLIEPEELVNLVVMSLLESKPDFHSLPKFWKLVKVRMRQELHALFCLSKTQKRKGINLSIDAAYAEREKKHDS